MAFTFDTTWSGNYDYSFTKTKATFEAKNGERYQTIRLLPQLNKSNKDILSVSFMMSGYGYFGICDNVLKPDEVSLTYQFPGYGTNACCIRDTSDSIIFDYKTKDYKAFPVKGCGPNKKIEISFDLNTKKITVTTDEGKLSTDKIDIDIKNDIYFIFNVYYKGSSITLLDEDKDEKKDADDDDDDDDGEWIIHSLSNSSKAIFTNYNKTFSDNQYCTRLVGPKRKNAGKYIDKGLITKGVIKLYFKIESLGNYVGFGFIGSNYKSWDEWKDKEDWVYSNNTSMIVYGGQFEKPIIPSFKFSAGHDIVVVLNMNEKTGQIIDKTSDESWKVKVANKCGVVIHLNGSKITLIHHTYTNY